jgi:hypothetical protein
VLVLQLTGSSTITGEGRPLPTGGREMIRFYYPKVREWTGYVCINDEKDIYSTDIPHGPNVSDRQILAATKNLWAHCRKLARQYAKRHGLSIVYTAHPDKPQAVWSVV